MKVVNEHEIVGGVAFIKASNTGNIFIIDAEDYDRIKDLLWRETENGYIISQFPGDVHILLHRLIMNAEKGEVVDHINHLLYDNRKDNLRVAKHGTGGRTMYDELIGRLRANGELFVKYIPNAEGEILLQAADAIEQLSNAGSAYGRGWTLGYDAGRGESKLRWIPVTEHKPNEDDEVLIYGEWVGASGTHYREMWMTTISDLEYLGYRPIAWMPLPEPPREE